MIVTINKGEAPKQFVPFTVALSITSQSESDALHALLRNREAIGRMLYHNGPRILGQMSDGRKLEIMLAEVDMNISKVL